MKGKCTFKSKHLVGVCIICVDYNCDSKMAMYLIYKVWLVVSSILVVWKLNFDQKQIPIKVQTEILWVKKKYQRRP